MLFSSVSVYYAKQESLALSFVPADEVVNIFEILMNAFPQNNDVDIDKIMMLILTK